MSDPVLAVRRYPVRQPRVTRVQSAGSSWFVDESKAKDYIVVATALPNSGLAGARKMIGRLVLPGQRSVHMNAESMTRRRRIVAAVTSLADVGLNVVILDADKRHGSDKARRSRCLVGLVAEASRALGTVQVTIDRDQTLVHMDRQDLIVATRALGVVNRLSYLHLGRHEELLLAVPDAVAWCWARGGEWRRAVRPLVKYRIEV
jgi:hypothetical protein